MTTHARGRTGFGRKVTAEHGPPLRPLGPSATPPPHLPTRFSASPSSSPASQDAHHGQTFLLNPSIHPSSQLFPPPNFSQPLSQRRARAPTTPPPRVVNPDEIRRPFPRLRARDERPGLGAVADGPRLVSLRCDQYLQSECGRWGRGAFVLARARPVFRLPSFRLVRFKRESPRAPQTTRCLRPEDTRAGLCRQLKCHTLALISAHWLRQASAPTICFPRRRPCPPPAAHSRHRKKPTPPPLGPPAPRADPHDK